jgi:hypothetical protein
MFPIVPIVSALAAATGAYGLYWYHNLSAEEQERADRTAMGYAQSLYGKALNELTHGQLQHVHDLVKGHFVS